MKYISLSVAVLLAVALQGFGQDPGWIGITVADRGDAGVLVREIDPNGPAAKAGIKENDVITAYDKQPVNGVLQLTRMVRETPVGRTVEVKVRRENADRSFQVTTGRNPNRFGSIYVQEPDTALLGDRIRDRITDAMGRIHIGASVIQSGLRVDSLTPQLRQFFGVKVSDGVLVSSVDPASSAEKAGLRAGDVILSVDGDIVDKPQEFSRQMRNAGKTIVLKIVRDKQEREITVQGWRQPS